jgi:hypothetical protein
VRAKKGNMALQDISAVVLVYGAEVLLLTEPDKLPANHAPFRVVGTLTSRDGQVAVSPVAEDKDANLLVLGAALPHFAVHVERVKAQRSHPDIDVLERLAALPDTRERT